LVAVLILVGAAALSWPDAAGKGRMIPNHPDQLCVVSLNLAKEPDARKVREDLEKAPCETVDVFLLQEVVHGKDEPSVAEQVGRDLGYSVAFHPAAPGVFDQGLAILSRFPLSEPAVTPLKTYDLKFRSRQRFTLSTVVHTPVADLHLWNVHLDTRINPAERVEQLDPVLRAAAGADRPGLIGGDLNTNRFHWLGNVLPYPALDSHAERVRKAMGSIGFQTPFADGTPTFPFLRQQLDWLYVRSVSVVDSGTFPARYSDHHAIWATLNVP
jgi:endonuclease/exonuclease/phosphatase family metal-dependent hydrolase